LVDNAIEDLAKIQENDQGWRVTPFTIWRLFIFH
jgi:hypothetical protein